MKNTVMSDAPSTDQGRWIRAALVIFPAGTILLGIASFGIWQWKKDRAADRSFKYALALRKTATVEALQRHAEIIRESLSKTDWLLSIPGYLESTMGAENMGYSVRRTRSTDGRWSNIDAELTGKTRPREVIMALVLYDDDTAQRQNTALAISEMLSVAHEITGESVVSTLRFAVIPNKVEALQQVRDLLRRYDERLMHLFILGGIPDVVQQRVQASLETTPQGTRVVSRTACATPQEALRSAQELKTQLLQAAGRP